MFSKKSLVLGFAAGLLAVPSVYAQSSSGGFYIGGGVGQSKISLDSSDFSGFTKDENDTAFKVFGGYNFTPIFGAELMYADMGKANATASGAGGSATLSYKASSFALAGTARFQLGSAFTIMGRLGGAQNTAKLSLDSTSGAAGALLASLGITPGSSSDKSKTDVYFGIGAQYDFNKNLGVRLDYDNFGKFGNEDDTGRAKVDMLSINAVWRF
jgi:OOP family OmpA-OmpF porin